MYLVAGNFLTVNGAIMVNTMSRADAGVPLKQSAVRNSAAFAGKIKLILIWLAVGLPLLWGAFKALENIGSLPL